MNILKIIWELYKLYKAQVGVNPKAAPKTVVIEAVSQRAATEIAEKIARDDPNVKIAVTAVTTVGVSALERLIEKKVLKK